MYYKDCFAAGRLNRRFRAFLHLLFLSSIIPFSLPAQSLDEIDAPTQTFAIENVRVVPKPGQVLENATIVFSDGLITAVGTNIDIPFDAERISGDSLWVYAGFIDGLSHVGIPAPKKEQNSANSNEKVNRANPTNEQAGVQPDRAATDLLKADDKSIDALRNVGFTAAHVVPRGKMLPGMGSLILLAGESPDNMVLKKNISMFAQLTGAGRVYPATPMGVMAKMRQLVRESARRKQMESFYASSTSGMPRPAYDAAHYAFFPVLEGNMPVFMHTTGPLDIYRAIQLQKTLGYPLMLSGLYGGFESIDLLLEANTPLFLTLKTPQDSTKKKDDTPPIAPEPSVYDPTLHVTDHTDTEIERINLEARRQIFRSEYFATAATMYDAGLNFGFSTKDVKPEDIHANISKMIEHGLITDIALASLTTIPSEIFGLSNRMGTIENGKMANLVITKGPLFKKSTKVKFVFVDGKKFEYDKPKKQ